MLYFTFVCINSSFLNYNIVFINHEFPKKSIAKKRKKAIFMRITSFNPQEKVFYWTKKQTRMHTSYITVQILLYLIIKKYFRSNFIIWIKRLFWDFQKQVVNIFSKFQHFYLMLRIYCYKV